MRRLLVTKRRVFVAEHLHQHEASRIILFLNDVEAKHPRFTEARARVLQSGGLEVLHELGFDLNLDVHDEHDRFLPGSARSF